MQDLQILILCLSIAEGEISPADLTVEQKSLLEDTNKNKQQKYGTLRNRGLQRLSSSLSRASRYFLYNFIISMTCYCFRIIYVLLNIKVV